MRASSAADAAIAALKPDYNPLRYHDGMSKQIAVRLPDELVDYIDELVKASETESRASFLALAAKRERRRRLAARDAMIYASEGEDPELEGLAAYAARVELNLD